MKHTDKSKASIAIRDALIGQLEHANCLLHSEIKELNQKISNLEDTPTWRMLREAEEREVNCRMQIKMNHALIETQSDKIRELEEKLNNRNRNYDEMLEAYIEQTKATNESLAKSASRIRDLEEHIAELEGVVESFDVKEPIPPLSKDK